MNRLFSLLMASILASFLGVGMAPFPAPLVPLDINVDRMDDPAGYQSCTSAPNDCSLRGAIALANSTLETVDTIIVPAGTYTLSLTGSDDDNFYGDLDIWAPVTIAGAGQIITIIQASPLWNESTDRVFHIFNLAGTVTITDLSIYNGKISSGAGGAGIYQADSSSTVVLERVLISDNHIVSSVGGGGILAKGNMTIIDSTIEENVTSGDGGGIYGSTGSHLIITRSTIAVNNAARGGGMIVFDSAILRNVTIFHNTATLGGGGISQWDDSFITLYNTTLFENHILGGASAGWEIENYGAVTAYASIFAAETTHYPCLINDIAGFSNLSTNSLCGTGFISADPLLENINRNGGYTQTCRLFPGSPAIDGADNSYCLLEDQRGITRPLDGNGDGIATCDIGAYEAYPVAGFLPLVRKP